MRKIFLSFLIIANALLVSAQAGRDQRTVSTKVTDILARFPFNNEAEKNSFLKSINELDAEGFRELVSRLTAPGKQDNTAVEYALSAFSANAIQSSNKTIRAISTEVFCEALRNEDLGFSRDFIIRQLELMGGDAAVSCLSNMLTDKQLGGAAARALASFRSERANQALLDALHGVEGENRMAVIEALGRNRYENATKIIEAELNSGDDKRKKVALNALSKIGSPSSYKPMLAAAKASGFNFEPGGAAGAYSNYLARLIEQEDSKKTARYVAEFMRVADASKNSHARVAGLHLYAKVNGQKSLPLLIRSVQDPSIDYRAAAIELAAPYSNSLTNRQWINALHAAAPEAKVQIIDHLASSEDKAILPQLQQYLNSEDPAVKAAAVRASAQIGRNAAVPSLLELMRTGSKEEIGVIKESLLELSSADLTQPILENYSMMPVPAKLALLDILSQRAAVSAAPLVLHEAQSADLSVSAAATKALPAVVTEKNTNELFVLLARAKPEHKVAIQRAIANSISAHSTTDQSKMIIRQMNMSAPASRIDFFPILSAIGDRESFNALQSGYQRGNDDARKAAIAAIANGAGKQPADIAIKFLKDSVNTSHRGAVVDALTNIVSRSNFPADQNILYLREAMEFAGTTEQKRRILREAAKNKSFPALVFAGEYLETADLKSVAAAAVMNIALADKNLNGRYVEDLLTKAMNQLSGADSEYQKQAVKKHLDELPRDAGFVRIFNGKDLSGWKGLVENPVKRRQMPAAQLLAAQKKADAEMKKSWIVENGLLIFTGKGENLVTEKLYGDIELYVDWKITKDGDAGIYLRGAPQVQIWDTARTDVGAQVGSGGLYNNQKHASKPLVMADNAIGEWNTFRIIMQGDRVTVWLNGQLVTDNVPMENYWDRNQPLFDREQLELQAHGTFVAYRNIFVKELGVAEKFVLSEEEKKDGFKLLFDGISLDQWQGNKNSYLVDNGTILVKPGSGSGGNLYSTAEYGDFVLRFEFQLTPGANNGLGVRTPLSGDAAYEGMEIQILDNDAPVYKNLEQYQYHGSVYGIIPAKRGYLKPTGEWNYQEFVIKGADVKVVLNGTTILEGNLDEATKNGTLDKREHPGLKRKKGHIAFLGHGSELRFRNIRIKEY